MAIGIVLVTLAVSACTSESDEPNFGISGDDEEVREVDMQGAADYVDGVLDDSLEVIDPPVEWEHLRTRESTCYDDPRDLPYQTGAVTRYRAVVTEISAPKRVEMMRQVERQWDGAGFEITDFHDDDPGYPSMTATTPDDFRLMLSVNSVGQFLFTMASPCFEEVEVAPPSSGPEYTGDNRPSPPDVHSDYWSEGG